MTEKMNSVRGTKDLYPEEFIKHRFVTDIAEKVGKLYGFSEMAVPIIEFAGVFKKTLGEESDVVGKEMYVFSDRGDNELCLRPEFTASIVRSFINSNMQESLPLRLYTKGPLFRYERPQMGRQRQFHQINFEVIGAKEPFVDVELIALGNRIIQELGIADCINIEINSLGDEESRKSYRDNLIAYFNDYKEQLSEDSKLRLIKNPMRILDSKDENDKKIVANAPIMDDYYSAESKDFFAKVQEGLNLLGINYKINSKLVRGLDYYCHTVFEFTTNMLGAQNTVLAGGRYNGLVKLMGGPDTPAVGCAGGIERLVGLLDAKSKEFRKESVVILLPIGENAEKSCYNIANDLRNNNINTEIMIAGNVKKRMKKADQRSADKVIIFGDEEILSGKVKIRNMQTGTEQEVKIVDIVSNI